MHKQYRNTYNKFGFNSIKICFFSSFPVPSFCFSLLSSAINVSMTLASVSLASINSDRYRDSCSTFAQKCRPSLFPHRRQFYSVVFKPTELYSWTVIIICNIMRESIYIQTSLKKCFASRLLALQLMA